MIYRSIKNEILKRKYKDILLMEWVINMSNYCYLYLNSNYMIKINMLQDVL